MGDKIELVVEDRSVVGKAAKTLHKQGYVPAVIYGRAFAPRSVMAPHMLMTKAYRSAGRHHPIELQLGDQKHLAIIKSADVDPVKRTLRHLAFQAIAQDEPIETEIPIIITGEGETPAERAGFVVLSTVEQVQVEALPNDLPDTISAPGDMLAVAGDRLTIGDLIVPAGVTILSDPEQVVATVYEPSALAAQNEALAGEAEEAVPSSEETEAAAETES